MATKSTNAKQDAAGRRVKRAGEPALASYADKKVTPVIEGFAAWLTEQTGYEVDPMSVYLGSALRSTFQKSDENQERIAASAQAKIDAQEAREQRAIERAETREAKEAAKAERAAAKAAAPAKEKAAPKAKVAPKSAPAKKGTAPVKTLRRPVAKGSSKSDF